MESTELDSIKTKLAYIKQHRGYPLDQDKNTPYDEDVLIKSYINFCLYWKLKLKALEAIEAYELCKEVMEVVIIQECFMYDIVRLMNCEEVPHMKVLLDQIRQEIMFHHII